MSVPADRLDAWVEADARHWTTFLSGCEGFVGKEVWVAGDRDDRVGMVEVKLVIRWRDQAAWDAVDVDRCAEVDRQMGDLVFDVSCRTFAVVETTSFR